MQIQILHEDEFNRVSKHKWKCKDKYTGNADIKGEQVFWKGEKARLAVGVPCPSDKVV